jgi:hypothetical protein
MGRIFVNGKHLAESQARAVADGYDKQIGLLVSAMFWFSLFVILVCALAYLVAPYIAR